MARLKGTIAGPPVYPVGFTLHGYWHTLKMDRYGAVVAGPVGGLGAPYFVQWAQSSANTSWNAVNIISVTTDRVLEVRTICVLHTASSPGNMDISLYRTDGECTIVYFRNIAGYTGGNWTGCVYLTNGTTLRLKYQMPASGVIMYVNVCAYWHEYFAIEEA